MANPSIYAAFERMWQHILIKIGQFITGEEVDTKIQNALDSIGVAEDGEY
jgi:hypothetical protein